MNRTRRTTRWADENSCHRCRTKPVLRVHSQTVRVLLLFLLAPGVMLLSACGEKAQGKITGAYQPLRSGVVQMYINVELDDGTEVDALLPNGPPWDETQKIWDKVSASVRRGKQLRVEIERKGSKELWEFVRFVDEVKTEPSSQ